MTSSIFGNIKHVSKGKYVVSLFNKKIKKTFVTIEESVKFVKYHAENFLSTNEVNNVAVHYERKDLRASYLIWEKVEVEGEPHIIEYEESGYEFVKLNRNVYKKHLLRKMLNEKYYSFHDFARINSLSGFISSIYKLLVSIVASLVSIFLLFYGLHTLYMSDLHDSISQSDKGQITFLIILGSIITPIISICSSISNMYPLYRIKKANDNFDDVNWRKINRMRFKLRIVILTFVYSGIIPIVLFVYISFSSGIFQNREINEYASNVYIIISMLSVVFFLLIGINSTWEMVRNEMFARKSAVKYFTEEEIVTLRKWLKYKTEKNFYKTDLDYFIYPIKQSEDIVFKKTAILEEMYKTSTDDEIQEYFKKQDKHYKRAIHQYMQTKEYMNDI